MSVHLDDAEAHTLLERFGLHVPITDERYLAHAQVNRGLCVTIDGHFDEDLGAKVIELLVDSVSAHRMCPLSELQANALLDEIHAKRDIFPHESAFSHMVTHLLIKCSKLYSESGIDGFVLYPVYLQEKDYRIGVARMFRSKALHLKERLEPHAHDRKAAFYHRPD
ncbi:MAG: hypothetical protein ACYDA1_02835 [Vulcanimicrobiaceae bacterium]